MKDTFSSSRRALLKGSVLGIAALAGGSLALRARGGGGIPHLSEDDPTAKALKYVHDATKSPDRKDTTAFCHNCRYFKGKKDAEWGPCDLFPGKQVNANGWCNVWAKKG